MAGSACAQESAEPAGQLDVELGRLIEQLGDQDYFVRRRAQQELAKFSFEAFDALRAATTHEDLEIAARAKYLLRLMETELAAKDDPPHVQALLADYPSLDEATKLDRIRMLARLADHQGVSALCRLVRYEKSPVLSKRAAIELVQLHAHDRPPNKELAERLSKGLKGSRQVAAAWPLAWLRFPEDAEKALAQWGKLVEAEHLLLAQSPTKTSPEIVAKLTRQHHQVLKKFGRPEQVAVATRRLMDLEKGNPATLAELLNWLVEQQEWESVKQLEARFKPQFAADPLLLYVVAQRQAEQGDQKEADATAARALKLNPEGTPRNLEKHYMMAITLQQRGLFQWAGHEYQHVIDTAEPGNVQSPLAPFAQYRLAVMQHDQGQWLPAAKGLEQMVKMLEKHPNLQARTSFKTSEIRSRMNCFYAGHYRQQNDLAKQREYLDKAIAADPTEIDTLIACYRLPDQEPEYREKIRKLVRTSTASLRRRVARNRSSATDYNQFAWLVGNTEGDFDEALRFSKK